MNYANMLEGFLLSVLVALAYFGGPSFVVLSTLALLALTALRLERRFWRQPVNSVVGKISQFVYEHGQFFNRLFWLALFIVVLQHIPTAWLIAGALILALWLSTRPRQLPPGD